MRRAKRCLVTVPTEIKIMILCELDDFTLTEIIRTSAAYRRVFKTYRSEIHTAVTLNTLRARGVDLELQTPLCWLEVATKFPEPAEDRYESRRLYSAILEYRKQIVRKNPRRKFTVHCCACHYRAIDSISTDRRFTDRRFEEACLQQDRFAENECEACKDHVMKSLEHQLLSSRPIRLTPEHCNALCSIQDVVGWFWPVGRPEIRCFRKPIVAPYRFAVHTYKLLVMDNLCTKRDFWNLLSRELSTEDEWFQEPKVIHKMKDIRDIQDWIERERSEPMDRSTFGPLRIPRNDWFDLEGMADAWNWLSI